MYIVPIVETNAELGGKSGAYDLIVWSQFFFEIMEFKIEWERHTYIDNIYIFIVYMHRDSAVLHILLQTFDFL